MKKAEQHQKEIKKEIQRPIKIDRKCFQKSLSEKEKLKELRSSHNKKVRSAGFNPKKKMNV